MKSFFQTKFFNFAKSLADYSFKVAHFRALHFENHDELDQAHLSKVGDHV